MTDSRPMKERLEEEKAKIEAIADPTEAMLALAEFKARVALMQGATHEASRNWKAQEKALKEYRAAKEAENSGERFRNIEQAAAWIIGQGFIVSPRSVRNHADKPGFPKRQKDGAYLKSEIETYAVATWENPGRPAGSAEPLTGNYSEEVKRETARKLKLANEITEGRYILRSEVEQQFAGRAAFLKQDLANFGPFAVDRFIEMATAHLRASGIDLDTVALAEIVPDLVAEYDMKLERWLDRYTRPLEVMGE